MSIVTVRTHVERWELWRKDANGESLGELAAKHAATESLTYHAAANPGHGVTRTGSVECGRPW